MTGTLGGEEAFESKMVGESITHGQRCWHVLSSGIISYHPVCDLLFTGGTPPCWQAIISDGLPYSTCQISVSSYLFSLGHCERVRTRSIRLE
jgi:hypothetical protein